MTKSPFNEKFAAFSKGQVIGLSLGIMWGHIFAAIIYCKVVDVCGEWVGLGFLLISAFIILLISVFQINKVYK